MLVVGAHLTTTLSPTAARFWRAKVSTGVPCSRVTISSTICVLVTRHPTPVRVHRAAAGFALARGKTLIGLKLFAQELSDDEDCLLARQAPALRRHGRSRARRSRRRRRRG